MTDRTLFRAEDNPPEPGARRIVIDKNGTAWQRNLAGDEPWAACRYGSERMTWRRLLDAYGPLALVPSIKVPSVDDENARHDNEPYQIVQHAEWRRGRLYLDGQPFPYATHEPPQVMDVLPLAEDKPALDWHVLYVPVVIDGHVDLAARPTPREQNGYAYQFGPLH